MLQKYGIHKSYFITHGQWRKPRLQTYFTDHINTCMTLILLQYNDKSVITIQRNGTATISPLKALQNDHIYSGVENELILSQVYTTSFTCKYDMGSYPFDTQRCSMVFIMQVSITKDSYADSSRFHVVTLSNKYRVTVENLLNSSKTSSATLEQLISLSTMS